MLRLWRVWTTLTLIVVVIVRSDAWQWREAPSPPFDAASPSASSLTGFSLKAAADVLAVGVPSHTSSTDSTTTGGRVHIYRQTADAAWTLETTLVSEEASFGHSLALTVNGYGLAIGSPLVNQATLYARIAGVWQNATVLTPRRPPLVDERHGWHVACAMQWCAVANPLQRSHGVPRQGSVSLYALQGAGAATYTQAVVPVSMIAESRFGTSLALTQDTLVVGAPFFNGHRGAVVLYTLNPTGGQDGEPWWEEAGQITLPGGGLRFDYFGHRVDLQSNVLVVSSVGRRDDAGAVHVYDTSSAAPVPTLVTTLQHETVGDRFGLDVALTTTMSGEYVLAVGVERANSMRGAVYTYTSSEGVEWQLESQTVPMQANSEFGWALAFVNDNLAVGAPQAAAGGQVHFFQATNETAPPSLAPVALASATPTGAPTLLQETITTTPTYSPAYFEQVAPTYSPAYFEAPSSPTYSPAYFEEPAPPLSCTALLRACTSHDDCCTAYCGNLGRCWMNMSG